MASGCRSSSNSLEAFFERSERFLFFYMNFIRCEVKQSSTIPSIQIDIDAFGFYDEVHGVVKLENVFHNSHGIRRVLP